MAPYSILTFQSELDNRTPVEIECKIRQGTKVYFFTYDPIDDIQGNEFLANAIKEHLLFLYEVRYHRELTEDFHFINGDVPENILDLLTEQTKYFNIGQYRIEHAPIANSMIVSAGAGTGKTTVMINRILFLKYVNPDLCFSEIGLVTFTNKAAHNMQKKLIQKLKIYFYFTKDMKYLNWIQELKNMTIGTIHSFAESIISINKNKLLEFPSLTISAFKHKRRKIIEEVIDEFNIEKPKMFSRFKYIEQYRIVQSVEMIIDQVMNHSVSVDQLVSMNFGNADDGSNHLYEYVVKKSCERLSEYKRSVHSMDVNDLIIAMDQIMQGSEQLAIPYKYLFVDEFQDTDRIQTKFFAYTANNFPVHLFVVGDVKQSIYRFRGADYTAFRQLKNQTEIQQEYYLQHNYRTDKKLLNMLDNVFTTWPEYVSSFSYGSKDKLINGLDSDSTLEQPFQIKRMETTPGRVNVLKELESTDTAVLVRTNKEVNALSKLCEEHNIFYASEQDGSFYRSIPVREFYQLVKRFTNPTNWKNRYLLHISSYGERWLEVNRFLSNFSPDRSIHSMLTDLDKVYEKYEEIFKRKPVFEVIHDIISNVKPDKRYANRFLSNKVKTENNMMQADILRQEYQMNLDQLIYQLKLELENTVPTLYKIEKTLRIKMQTDKTMSTIYKEDPNIDRLSIMTVHKAKGLEFDQVFLPLTNKNFVTSLMTNVIIHEDSIGYHVNVGKGRTYQNNIYRNLRKEETIENIGEEARLLYVALTRAKKGIIVDASMRTNNHQVKNWRDLIAKGLSGSTEYQTLLSTSNL